jgi:hypothetical protein
MGGSQRFCAGCGHELRPDRRFCTVCGRAVGEHGERGPVADQEAAPALYPRAELSQPPPREPVSTSSPATIAAGPRGITPSHASSRPWAGGRSVSPGPEGLRPDEESRGHSRWPLVVVLVVLLAGGATAAGVFFLQSSHKAKAVAGRNRSQPATLAPSSAPASASPATQSPPGQAVESLAALLTQSITDRSSVVQAVSDVTMCGPDLSQDSQAFRAAATSRQDLLSRLADLPDRSDLSGPMLQALTGAWKASVRADQDFAQWAHDEVSQGCVKNDHSDPGYQAAVGPDSQATVDKKSFTRLWNPLAAQYGLTPYQWNQL